MTPPIEPGVTRPGSAEPGRSRANDSRTHHTADDLREQATAEAGARADALRESTADKADTLADSVDAAARELSQDDIGNMSGYVSDIADQLRNVSGTLREKSGDELLHDVGQLAREKPAVFLAGAVAIGFGLGRFARSSQRPHHGERDQLPVPAADATAHVEPPRTAHTAGAAATSATASAAGIRGGTDPSNAGIAGSTLGTGAATPGTYPGGTGQ